MDNELQPNIFKGHKFIGFFSLINSDKFVIEDDEQNTVILGFSIDDSPDSVIWIDSHDKAAQEGQRMPKKKEGRQIKTEPISIVFSGLSTPNDFFDFAEKHGSLFGFKERFIRDGDNHVEPITENLLLNLFSMKKGEKSRLAMSRANKKIKDVKPLMYETLNDWMIASKLLKFAFLLNTLLQEGFDYEDVNYSEFEITKSKSHLYKIASSRNSNFRLFITDTQVQFITGIVDEEDTYLQIFRRRELPSESPFQNKRSQDSHLQYFDIYADSGLANEVAIISSIPIGMADIKKRMRQAFEGAIDCLVNFHIGGVGFRSVNGKMVYMCDSLISYLWFDFLSSVNGLVKISTCDYCGRPFSRHNHGQEKRFCCELHKKNWHNNSKKQEGDKNERSNIRKVFRPSPK